MADSNITKRALSSALKELMQETPFAKISVADICEKCDMNRKSFYYHFKDKYELVNWIFDIDFIDLVSRGGANRSLEEMTALCRILFENRRFYCNALSVQGQNSLNEHIREITLPILRERMREAMIEEASIAFAQDFFLDALLGAILRWIRDEDCEPPERFLPHFFACITSASKYILKRYSDDAGEGRGTG